MKGQENKTKMTLYSVTIRVDGRNFETKPKEFSNEADALSYWNSRKNFDFPNAEDVDIVNIEKVEQESGK